jgi:hypothetical protein
LSVRNNEDRFSAQQPDLDPPASTTQDTTPQSDPFSFVVPTEFVELPSRGEFYPANHPLHGQETIEIKYMTAKEEDILTSQSLLEKGIALERLMTNLIVDKTIKPEALLSGDRNAILIAARKSGYGADYVTNITCPSCGEAASHDFNLDEVTTTHSLTEEALQEAEIGINVRNHFVVRLPKNPVDVEFRMLTGKEENFLLKQSERRKKKKQSEHVVTDQLKLIIVSVNEYTEPDLISKFVDTMTLTDTRFLREAYQKVMPNTELRKEFVCGQCDYEDDINFPFTADFFWPQS